jgi:photosystem II stability/assembly factor-like uncharacterized protein
MASFTVLRTGDNALLMALIAIAIHPVLAARPNQWTSVGPEGGSVHRIAADPNNPSTLYAGTCNAGIFKTVDGAASWHAVNTGLPTSPADTIEGTCFGLIEIDPQNSGTVYAASQYGVFKTTDGGAHWNAIAGPTGCVHTAYCPQSLASLAFDPQNPGTLYASQGGGVFKSIDGGATWTGLTPGFNGAIFLIADPQNSGTVYASPGGQGQLSGLYKSTDAGASWNLVHQGVAFALALDPRNSNILYLSNVSGTGSGTVYGISKSTDGGASWHDLGLKPPECQCIPLVGSIVVSPENPALINAMLSVFGTPPNESFSLLTSVDGGAHWYQSADSTLAANDLNSITPDAQDPGTWYLGTNNGILKTTDGGASWGFANSGLRATPVGQVFIDPVSGALLAARYWVSGDHRFDAFFRSTDGGNSWAPSGSGAPSPQYHGPLIVRPNDPSTLYTGALGFFQSGNGGQGWTQGLFQSGDGGQSWSLIWVSTPPPPSTLKSLTAVAINPKNPNDMYMGASYCPFYCDFSILRSGDGGRTWAQSMASLEEMLPLGCSDVPVFSVLAVDPQTPNVLYGGTESIPVSGGGCGGTLPGLWKSVDGGINWVNLTNTPGVITDWQDVTAILVDPQNPGTVYFSTRDVHKTTDGGKTWTTVLQGAQGGYGPADGQPVDFAGYIVLPYVGYDILAMDPQNSGTVYAAGSGISRSTDAGATWTSLCCRPVTPIPGRAGSSEMHARAGEELAGALNSIAVDPRDSRTVYAATTNGLFKITLDSPQR